MDNVHNVTTVTTYVSGLEYRNDTLQFFGNGEGRYRVVNNALVTDYFLKDHLGNTRMVLTDDSAKADYPILQEQHYYPFGMVMEAISINKESSPNRYLFNGGTELNGDFDIDLYETPNRGYDAQLGRFWQQDALADSYSGITPYQFGFDNPVQMNDPSGLEPYEGSMQWIHDQRETENNVYRAIAGGYYKEETAADMYFRGMENNANFFRGLAEDFQQSYFRDNLEGLSKLLGPAFDALADPDFSGSRMVYDKSSTKFGNVIAWEDAGDAPTDGYDPGDPPGKTKNAQKEKQAWYGNFTGPGPDGPNANPFNLKDFSGKVLKPINGVDNAAQKHDYFYWKIGASGIKSALFDLRTISADKALSIETGSIFIRSLMGKEDPLTGQKIGIKEAAAAYIVSNLFMYIYMGKKLIIQSAKEGGAKW